MDREGSLIGKKEKGMQTLLSKVEEGKRQMQR